MSQDLPQRIIDFFDQNKDRLIENIKKAELAFLETIGFENGLNLEKDTSAPMGLFGKDTTESDYRPIEDPGTIIEVKHIRQINESEKRCYNESAIKDSFGQIMEQAICKKVNRAILVIIDAGRGSKMIWDTNELTFLSLFQRNPIGINLTVIRVIVDENEKQVTCSLYEAGEASTEP